MKQNLLVIGATGMLGKSIIEHFKEDSRYEVYGISRIVNEEIKGYNRIIMDITDSNKLKKILNEINPNIIIHCAANTNVDNCNNNRTYTYKLHVEATEILAKFNCRYVYISTDSVFDGMVGNYSEEDKTNPLNYYAKTKLEGEKVSLASNSKALILRTNIYGFHLEKKSSLVEWALENLLLNNKINGFNDVYFNPIYVGQLARVIKKLCTYDDVTGVLNIGSREYISKYEFLIKLAHAFNVSEKLIIPQSIDSVNFNAQRPRNTTLNLDRLNYILEEVPSIDYGIQELSNDYYNFFRNKEEL